MTRCPKECEKQWRPKQEKSGWQKQKEEKNKPKKGCKMEVRKVTEE